MICTRRNGVSEHYIWYSILHPCVLVKILYYSYNDGWVSNIVVDVVIGSVTVLV
jgi:hypothetical protein